MTTRRSLLKGVTLGAGSLALSPFLDHYLRLEAEDADQRLPMRSAVHIFVYGAEAGFKILQNINELYGICMQGHAGAELIAPVG